MSYIPDINKRPFHHMSKHVDGECYCSDEARRIQIMYIVASIVWIMVLYIGNFVQTYDIISILILSIPIIAFLINYNGCKTFSRELGSEIFRGNLLSFVFLIFIIFINWEKVSDKNKFFRILVVALIFVMFSLIDLWMSPDNMELYRHIKTALQTAALSLLAFAIYRYYLSQTS